MASNKDNALPFDIVPVAADNVPDAPRKNSRDDERWNFLKNFLSLPENHGQWFKVKDFDNTGAGVVCSNINNDKNKTFPASEYEARYTKNKDDGTSALFLSHRVASA